MNGEITTKIDTSTSYGMLGNGLTEARKLLSSKNAIEQIFNLKLCDELKNKELTLLLKYITKSLLNGILKIIV